MISFGNIASKIFGSANDRRVRNYQSRVDGVGALEDEVKALSDEDLRARTVAFRKQIEDGATLDSLIEPAFATVREAGVRTLGQRHFDVQLIGGMALHEGKIAEMKTGEGKTLVATLAVYLNALAGRGVHVVTVNDYLARRDAGWMGQVYRFLGLTVGCIVNEMDDDERKQAYACDVTYGTNNEFGFDYLRDNMKMSKSEMVQRDHFFAIVDEVDSILIDEARTPLIISGPVEDKAELYNAVDAYLPELITDKVRFELDEKQRQVSLTEAGNVWVEEKLGEAGLLTGTLYDIENVSIVHHINQGLKAHTLFLRDRDYIVRNNEVVIIDEFTGRMMAGRRYSEGLHQALEAKEKVEIQPENQTLASITFQNYFRLYEKLAGMTGTAETEASEFMDIYGLDVLEIPTHRPIARFDDDDEIYRTEEEKWTAIIDEIERARERGQPILVGTASIEKSELLSGMLTERKVQHQVLNARYHEQEAKIIANAGAPGAITIATNMAGRGTDIQLGGNLDMRVEAETEGLEEGEKRDAKVEAIKAEIDTGRTTVLAAEEVVELEPAKGNRAAKTVTYPGGLFVIGTERHESRRIDNQLRGRSGRQGDPGRSKFYLSLQDDLMRIFGSDRMDSVLKTLGLQKGEAISHSWMNKSLEMAQKKVEARNFDMRKQILKYDDVMNDQRKVIFEQRIDIMAEDDVSETINGMRDEVVQGLIAKYIPEKAYAEQWDIDGLKEQVTAIFGLELPIDEWAEEEGIADEEISDRLSKAANEAFDKKIEEVGTATLEGYESAKAMLEFVAGEQKMSEFVKDPGAHLEDIGHLLLSQNEEQVRLNGVDLAAAQSAAGEIGYQFMTDYMTAQALVDQVDAAEAVPARVGKARMREIEKAILLQILDHLWREHLVTLEHLREVIGFRAFGQRDPLNEYKTEAFVLFEAMLDKLREVVTGQLMHIDPNAEDAYEDDDGMPAEMIAQHDMPESAYEELAMADAAIAGESRAYLDAEAEASRLRPVRTRVAEGERDPDDPETWGKVARNAPCPCGSGKKYKHCHGRH